MTNFTNSGSNRYWLGKAGNGNNVTIESFLRFYTLKSFKFINFRNLRRFTYLIIFTENNLLPNLNLTTKHSANSNGP